MTRFTFMLVVSVLLLLTADSGGREAPNLEITLEAQKKLVSEQPHHAEGYNDLGNLLVLAERLEEAESAYGKALELDSTNTSAGFNLGLLLQQGGRFKEAIQAFKTVMEIDPSHAWATYQAGAVLHEQGKRKAAVEYYAQAFALDSSLTFAKTNPHLIDNSLATQALLMSEKYTAPASARMPRLYGEPERIVNLMLGVEETRTAETSAERATGEERASATSQKQNRKRRPRPLEQAGEVEEPRQRQSSQAGSDDDEDEEDQPRRLQSVQVVGGAVAGSANTGRRGENARENSRQGATPGRGATVNRDRGQNGGTTGGGNVQRPSPSRSRYRPATTSTGRLELELLPEEKESERVTR